MREDSPMGGRRRPRTTLRPAGRGERILRRHEKGDERRSYQRRESRGSPEIILQAGARAGGQEDEGFSLAGNLTKRNFQDTAGEDEEGGARCGRGGALREDGAPGKTF